MKIQIPASLFEKFHRHLFKGELEQGAFFFGDVDGEYFIVDDLYLVPDEGWDVQLDVYLEMNDSERGKIMQTASQRGCGIIDCHSHPGSAGDVWFSASDIAGITSFAAYAKWKLKGKPYVATVWGESSVDAIRWDYALDRAGIVEAVEIEDGTTRVFVPRGSWFREPRAYRRKDLGLK